MLTYFHSRSCGCLPKNRLLKHVIFFFFKGEELVRADSELEESEDSEPEEVEEFNLSKVEAKPVDPPSKTPTGPPLASGNKSNRQLTTRIEEVLIL